MHSLLIWFQSFGKASEFLLFSRVKIFTVFHLIAAFSQAWPLEQILAVLLFFVSDEKRPIEFDHFNCVGVLRYLCVFVCMVFFLTLVNH